MSAAGSNPAPSATANPAACRDHSRLVERTPGWSSLLLRATELERNRVVDQVVEPLAVALEISEQANQLLTYRLHVSSLEHLRADCGQLAEETVPLALQHHLTSRQPGISRAGVLAVESFLDARDAMPDQPAPHVVPAGRFEGLLKPDDGVFETGHGTTSDRGRRWGGLMSVTPHTHL